MGNTTAFAGEPPPMKIPVRKQQILFATGGSS
jgi:hypothetical protein